MMGDPPRLRSASGSLEALLLRSSRTLEPPPSAEEEVWGKLQVMTAAGAAATAAGLAAPTAAGSKIVAKALWLSALKWGAVLAVAVPAAGVATHYALHRPAAGVAVAPAPVPIVSLLPNLAGGPLQAPAPEAAESVAAPAVVAPLVAPAVNADTPLAQRVRGIPGRREASSALKKEGLSLGAARAKFAQGDARGALEDASRLGAEFPHGRLVQEREVLAIDCLAALGDTEAERSRAHAFLARFPASPYVAHVRQLLER
jgi:hypothetical protein